MKGKILKKYYDLEKEEVRLKNLFREVISNLKVDEEKGIKILLIGPGYGRLEIPLLDAFFAKFGKIDFKISIIEPDGELLQEFKSNLETKIACYNLRERISLKFYEDRFENVDLKDQEFNFISIFFVLQYVDSQLEAIKRLKNYLSFDGLIIWGEEKGWLSFIDEIRESKSKVPIEWEKFWTEFHKIRNLMGKPYTNPIKESDHSLIEFIYKNSGYEKIFDEKIEFIFDSTLLKEEVLELFEGRICLSLFLGLNNKEFDEILSKVSGKITDFKGPRSERIKIICLKKNELKPNELKFHQLLSSYFFYNRSILDGFQVDKDISNDELFKQLCSENKFHSEIYEQVIIKRRLFTISCFLFKLLNRRIHFDYILWQPKYGNFFDGQEIEGLPLILYDKKDRDNIKTYFSWYIFYFLARDILNITSTFIDFILKEIPFFDEIDIIRKENCNDIKVRDSFLLKKNALEINVENIDEKCFARLSVFNDDILKFGESFIGNEDNCFYTFSKIFSVIEDFKRKNQKKIEKIRELIKNEYERFYNKISAENIKTKIKNLLSSYSPKNFQESYYNDFMKNLFCINFIDRGNWKKVQYKLGFIFKKDKTFEGYHVLVHICPGDLVDDEIIDVTLDAVLPFFAAKDGLYVSNRLIKQEVSKNATKSAIAAIMSRNVSHNIGSHILSTLGYKGMSAADDRILFRYLHQRMDYIAQISTEMPKWTQSTWFLNDLMKRFYMQENILKYLGHSEGLKAYYYKKTGNKDAIEIKVNKKIGKEWGKSVNIIPGSSPNDKTGKLEDFQLAIPGGVVGCHAFYTILENFIRNAAKHDWGKADKKGNENLEITIEFENNLEKDHIHFAVYYNIPLEKEKEKKVVEDTLNASFKKSFIDDKGELRRENWGLGEMRISAGYLLKKDYGDIGFGGNDVLFEEKGNSFSGIIKAKAIEIGGKKFLGYSFAVPKPKELLFIGKWSDLKEDVKLDAKRYGIRFDEKIPPEERDYNFIIFEGNIFEQECPPGKKDGKPDDLLIIKFLDQFPARIFIIWDVNSNSELKDFIETKSPILRRRIVSLTKEASKIWMKFDPENKDFDKLKISIYKRWIDHLVTFKKIECLKIHIDLEGRGTDPGDEKKSKIFQYLLDTQLERILIETHDNTVRHANIGYQKIKDILIVIIEELFLNARNLKSKNGLYDFFRNQLSERIESEEMKRLYPEEKYIKQIKEYKNHFCDHFELLFDSIFDITRDMIYKDETMIATLPQVFKNGNSSNRNISRVVEEINQISLDSAKKKIEIEDTEEKADIIYKRHTPESLGRDDKQYCEALSGSQTFFNILDNYLKEGEKNEKESQKILLQLIENALIHITIIDERIRDFYVKKFKGKEKDKFKSAKISIPLGIAYTEGDGSDGNNKDRYKISFALKSEYREILKEEGKEKGKIKDEIVEKLKKGGIYFVEEGRQGKPEYKKLEESETWWMERVILIIHQGIIDKMDFKEPKDQKKFLRKIKKYFPYVIITSGRGDPMSEETKFIPFSSIESFLMTDYHEKNLLVQTSMQIFKESKKNV